MIRLVIKASTCRPAAEDRLPGRLIMFVEAVHPCDLFVVTAVDLPAGPSTHLCQMS